MISSAASGDRTCFKPPFWTETEFARRRCDSSCQAGNHLLASATASIFKQIVNLQNTCAAYAELSGLIEKTVSARIG